MKLTVSIDQGDGPELVDIGPRAQVAWERRTKRRVSDLATGIGMDDLAFMAYAQLGYEDRRDAAGTYDQWLTRLVDVDVDGAKQADPT